MEPPVPARLQQLTPSLERFIEVFQIEKATVAAAAKASNTQTQVDESALRQKIEALSRTDCDEWLLRLAKGDKLHLRWFYLT